MKIKLNLLWSIITNSIKNTESKNSKVSRILSKCAVCDNKKLRFTKNQETSGLLSGLKIETPLDKIPLVGKTLF